MDGRYIQKDYLQKKILIIGDSVSGNRMKDMLLRFDSQVDIHGPLEACDEVQDALLQTPDYNLIFSSFSLRDGDVLDVFRVVQPRCFVAFYSPCDRDALQSVERLGVNCFVAPWDMPDFVQVLERKWMASACLLGTVVPTASMMYLDRVLVCRNGSSCLLMAKDISYFHCEGRKTYAVDSHGEEYLTYDTIGRLEARLNPDLFFRINRRYLVNVSSVKSAMKVGGSRMQVILRGCAGRLVYVSRARCTAFNRWRGGRA